MGKRRDAYRVLVGKPEGNRSFGRPRPIPIVVKAQRDGSHQNSIKMNLK
jgi:hypothetical protein